MTGTGSTVPFNGLFDNLFVEMCVIRGLNRDEYKLDLELKWMNF